MDEQLEKLCKNTEIFIGSLISFGREEFNREVGIPTEACLLGIPPIIVEVKGVEVIDFFCNVHNASLQRAIHTSIKKISSILDGGVLS